MPDNKNKKGQDAKLISAKQESEVEYMKTKYGVPKTVTREIIKRVGHSRAKIYVELRKLKYPVPALTSK
jgi:hypothetical protein